MSDEIKPCPFCGGEITKDYDEEIAECNWIQCSLTKEMHESTWNNAYCWKELDRLRALNERYKKALEDFEKAQQEILAIIRRENFVFDNTGGRWEKLAFSLYTEICSISSIAKQALTETEEKRV